MKIPKISVITVCYNAARTIERTIHSVIEQGYPNLEYVLVDGGSTDNTIEIISKYKDKINSFISEPDNGIYDAMNKGLFMATGEWVVFLNADDVFLDGALHHVAEAILQNPEAIIGEAYTTENLAGKMRIRRLTPVVTAQTVYYGQPFCHQALFLRRSVYQKLGGFDTSYRIVADYDYTLRLFEYKFRYHILEQPLVLFTTEGLSSTNQLLSITEAARCLLRHQRSRQEVAVTSFLRILKTFGFKLLRTLHLDLIIKAWFRCADSWGLRQSSPGSDYLPDAETQKIIEKYQLL